MLAALEHLPREVEHGRVVAGGGGIGGGIGGAGWGARLHVFGLDLRDVGRLDAFAAIDVEHGDLGDPRLVGALNRPDQIARRHPVLDHKGKVAAEGHQGRQIGRAARLGLRAARFGQGLEDQLEAQHGPFGVQRLQRGRRIGEQHCAAARSPRQHRTVGEDGRTRVPGFPQVVDEGRWGRELSQGPGLLLSGRSRTRSQRKEPWSQGGG